MINHGVLRFEQTTDGTYNGAVSGAGVLEKTGAGFTGDTRVEQGGLSVNGDWSDSAFSVASGGTLGGDGRLGDTTVASGATLAAGSSIGTLAVSGDLTLAPGSVLAVEVGPTGSTSDRIEVSGQASLAGSVMHVGNNGHYRPFSEYTFFERRWGDPRPIRHGVFGLRVS